MNPPLIAVWREYARANAPAGRGPLVAPILADLANPATGTVRLDDAAVHRIVEGARVLPVGLSRILEKFVTAGLLVPSTAGSYTLTFPLPHIHRPKVCRHLRRRRADIRLDSRRPSGVALRRRSAASGHATGW
jgi:hypothetical protein